MVSLFGATSTGELVPPRRKKRVLALDIGNAFAKVFVVAGDDLGGFWSFRKDDPTWLSRLSEIASRSHCEDCVISSVVPQLTQAAYAAVAMSLRNVLVVSGDMDDLPLEIEYARPDTLGADRICAAYGAVRFYADDLAPEDALIVVDAGTAITVDCVRDVKFLGGAILPGLSLMRAALYQNAAQLSKAHKKIAPQFPGKGTQQCIEAGVVAAAVGAVNFLAQKYVKNAPKKKIVVTGGDGKFFGEYLAPAPIYDELLVVRGAVAILDFVRNGESNG